MDVITVSHLELNLKQSLDAQLGSRDGHHGTHFWAGTVSNLQLHGTHSWSPMTAITGHTLGSHDDHHGTHFGVPVTTITGRILGFP